jgi:hypothetical protein
VPDIPGGTRAVAKLGPTVDIAAFVDEMLYACVCVGSCVKLVLVPFTLKLDPVTDAEKVVNADV